MLTKSRFLSLCYRFLRCPDDLYRTGMIEVFDKANPGAPKARRDDVTVARKPDALSWPDGEGRPGFRGDPPRWSDSARRGHAGRVVPAPGGRPGPPAVNYAFSWEAAVSTAVPSLADSKPSLSNLADLLLPSCAIDKSYIQLRMHEC